MINNKKQAAKPNAAAQVFGEENNIDEDSILEEDDLNFALRNQNYQLKSTIHKLEYDKNKLTISYETTIKEFKHKYATFEKIMTERSEKQEKLIQHLSEENQQLKRDLHASSEQYRTTPNFKQLNSNSDGFTGLIAQLQKPQNLAYFQKMMEAGTQKMVEELKGRVALVQKQNHELKQLALRTQRQKQQTIHAIGRQTEEHHNSILKFKDKSIQQLKNSHIQISLQLQQAKKTISHMSSSQSDSNTQQKNIKMLVSQAREKDSKITELEQNLYKTELQYNRIKLQKTKAENDLKLFENERKQSESKRKLLHEQLFRLQNELSQVKTAAYNQKLQSKKILNSIKSEVEDEKMRLKYLLQEKSQQNKRIKDAVYQLNETNEQIRQKEQSLIKQNNLLKENCEKLMREMQDIEKKLNSAQKSRFLFQQKDLTIDKLKKQLVEAREEVKRLSYKIQQSNTKFQDAASKNYLGAELNHKQELIQLLKMDKDEISQKVRELEARLKEKQDALIGKKQTISNQQQKIRYLQEDNQQLILANDQQREKIQKLKRIKEDIENINSELKKEKVALAEKKKAESRIKIVHERQKGRTVDSNRSRAAFIQKFSDQEFLPQQIMPNKSKQSTEARDALVQLVKQLKYQNSELQNRLNQAQNERDRKGVDLNIKESQLKNLKFDAFKPKQILFEPLIQVSKKNQFNAVFFENQVQQLQKEISSIRTMKQKELDQVKKTFKKQMDQKYQKMLMREKAYNSQLQKKCNYLTQKLNQQKKMGQDGRQMHEALQKENYSLKLQLSQNLEQLNKTLQSCKFYEQKLKESQRFEKKTMASFEQFSKLKPSYDSLAKSFQEQSLLLNNANQQIRRLNDILMIKQSQLKVVNKSKIHQFSPNNSFMRSSPNEEKQRSIQALLDLQKSGEGEAIRTWAPRKSGPIFSRI